VSPDIPDSGGMTALMWASWKILSLDPVRLLLTLGANPNQQDMTHGNTALHWAILARNPRAIWSLIIRGKANLEIRNHRGDTPLQLLQRNIGSNWIHFEVADRIKHVTQKRSKPTLLMKIMMSERIRYWTLVLIPFFFLFSIGLILATNLNFFLKLLLIGICGTIVSITKRVLLNEDLQAQLPLYFYWASKAFFYVSWIFYLGRVMSTFTITFFIILNIFLWITFLRLWRGDCGVIKLKHNQRLQTILELSDQTLETGKNGFDPSSFCSACLVRKPKRSKHCSICDRCVGVSL
jgi:palmitoyltransferase ZDHHC13/17